MLDLCLFSLVVVYLFVYSGDHPESELSACVVCVQERQRLETILSLCAEYNKGDLVVDMETERAGQFPRTDSQRPGLDLVGVAVQRAHAHTHRLGECDDENLKEECSSTESQHQEVRHFYSFLYICITIQTSRNLQYSLLYFPNKVFPSYT